MMDSLRRLRRIAEASAVHDGNSESFTAIARLFDILAEEHGSFSQDQWLRVARAAAKIDNRSPCKLGGSRVVGEPASGGGHGAADGDLSATLSFLESRLGLTP